MIGTSEVVTLRERTIKGVEVGVTMLHLSDLLVVSFLEPGRAWTVQRALRSLEMKVACIKFMSHILSLQLGFVRVQARTSSL